MNMMSHDWFSAGKNKNKKKKNAADSFFPLGIPPLWALFQAGFVFQNIEYKLFLLSFTDSALSLFLFAPASSGHGPELAAAGALVSD